MSQWFHLYNYICARARLWWSEHIRVLDSKCYVVHPERESMACRGSQSICFMHCYSHSVKLWRVGSQSVAIYVAFIDINSTMRCHFPLQIRGRLPRSHSNLLNY